MLFVAPTRAILSLQKKKTEFTQLSLMKIDIYSSSFQVNRLQGPSRHTTLPPVSLSDTYILQSKPPNVSTSFFIMASHLKRTFLAVFSQQDFLLVLCIRVDFYYIKHAQSAITFYFLLFPLYSVFSVSNS